MGVHDGGRLQKHSVPAITGRSFNDLFRALPEALWHTGPDGFEVFSSAEMLEELPTSVLRQVAVQIDHRFYLPEDRCSMDAEPILTLVHYWSADTSLAAMLQSCGQAAWVDSGGAIESAEFLLDNRSLAELGGAVTLLPVEVLGHSRAIILSADGRSVLGSIEEEDNASVVSAIVALMRKLDEARHFRVPNSSASSASVVRDAVDCLSSRIPAHAI